MKNALLLIAIVVAVACLTSASAHGKTYSQPALRDPLRRVLRAVRNRPCVCTYHYQPVCGSNLHSYGNACALNCEAEKTPHLRRLHDGECTPSEKNNVRT